MHRLDYTREIIIIWPPLGVCITSLNICPAAIGVKHWETERLGKREEGKIG